ncbi:hypothetical protein ACPCB7_24365 [Streptomyces arboris]|uniref:hypothetical protein n=2 Tax=Streptomyces TaxID=1883 RepID=UPI00211B42FA
MGVFTYTDLVEVDLGKLSTATAHWKTVVDELAKLKNDVRDTLVKKSDGARWHGINATVTKEFVHSAAKEFGDLHREALDAAVSRALKKSHGGDPYNAGHSSYTSLDQDQVPRA